MAEKKPELKGAGSGGGAPEVTPDNLRSEDTFEVLVGLCEGPIYGLKHDLKNLYIDDTPVMDHEGNINFEGISVDLHRGDRNLPDPVKMRLGGTSLNHSVGVLLERGLPVIRSASGSGQAGTNRLEVRILINSLFREKSDGSVREGRLDLNIRYRPKGTTTWTPFIEGNIGRCENMTPLPAIEGVTSDIACRIGHQGKWVPSSNSWYDDGEGNSGYGAGECFPPDDRDPENATACSVEGGTWVQEAEGFRIVGKTTSSPYVREFAIDVPPHVNGYEIEVEILGPDETHDTTYNVQWESWQEVIREEKSYPGTALLRIDSGLSNQFSSIPSVWGVYHPRKVLVPTNYDPVARTYTGDWDGVSFKEEVTDNPAWILYDMYMSPDLGMQAYQPDTQLDVWDTYEYSQWCDNQVPIYNADGSSAGTQPRHTMNVVLSNNYQGKEAIRYVAGAVNAMTYDSGEGLIRLRSDQNEDAHVVFGPENVVDGLFNYSETDTTSRYNEITATFVNPEKSYEADTVVVRNEDLIAANGLIQHDFTAVGATNVHEAVRRANTLIISANTETLIVQFQVVRPRFLLEPMSTILIADPDMEWGISGRIKNIDNGTINLGRPIYIEQAGTYTLKIQDRTDIEEIIVDAQQGSIETLLIRPENPPLPNTLPELAMFTLEMVSQDNSHIGEAQAFKVISIEDGEEPETFNITATLLNRNKHTEALVGANVDAPTYGNSLRGYPTAPSMFSAVSDKSAGILSESGEFTPRIAVRWQAPEGELIKGYLLRWKGPVDTQWSNHFVEGSTSYDIPNVQVGESYDIQVYSENTFGLRSRVPTTINDHVVVGPFTASDTVSYVAAIIEDNRVKIRWGAASDQILVNANVHLYEVAKGTELDAWDDLEFIGATQYFELYDPNYNAAKPHYFVRVLYKSGTYSNPIGVNVHEGFDNVPQLSHITLSNAVDLLDTFNNKHVTFNDLNADFTTEAITDPRYRGYKWSIFELDGTTLVHEQETADPFFSLTYQQNRDIFGGSASRKFVIEVALVTVNGRVGGNAIRPTRYIENQVPQALANLTSTLGPNYIDIAFDKIIDDDNPTVTVWMGASAGVALNAANVVYQGNQNQIRLSDLTPGETYYWRVGVTDAYDDGNDAWTSAEFSSITVDWSALTGMIDSINTMLADPSVSISNNADFINLVNTTSGSCSVVDAEGNAITTKTACETAGGTWTPVSAQSIDAAQVTYLDANGVQQESTAGVFLQALADGDVSASAGAALFANTHNKMAGIFVNIGLDDTGTVAVLADAFKIQVDENSNVTPFQTVGNTVLMNNAMIQNLGAGHIDTRGLTIKDANGNVIFSAGENLDFDRVGGVNKPENGATVGADWGSNLQNIPADMIYNNDDAAALGFNPTFSKWTGTYPEGWSVVSSSAGLVKESADVQIGDFAVRYDNLSSGTQGLYHLSSFPLTPMPADVFLMGAVGMKLLSYSSGKPAILVRLYTNSGLSSYRDTWVEAPDTSTNQWQRVPWAARTSPGEQIYGIAIYVYGRTTGNPSGAFTGSVIFDNLHFGLFDDSVDNKTITLNADGSLSGGGGGQVTAGGIGAATPAEVDAAEQAAKDYSDSKFVDAVIYNADIADLQAQIDGNITTWFGNIDPTLSNEPAVNWNTNELKEAHRRDMYYNESTGKAWRFKLVSGTTYTWTEIVDTEITAALQAASDAQDTADGKRRVFVVTPSGPYDEGDLWDTGSSIKVSTATRASGYYASDWQVRGDVTQDQVGSVPSTNFPTEVQNSGVSINSDGTLTGAGGGQVTPGGIGADTSVETDNKVATAKSEAIADAKSYADSTFKNLSEYNSEQADIQNQLDGKVEIFFETQDPTLANSPANSWTTNELKAQHVNDLYFNKTKGTSWQFKNVSGSTYVWEQVEDPRIGQALTDASTAQATADSKIRMFTSTPSGPYSPGDIWESPNGPRTCKTALASGPYVDGHWNPPMADKTADTIGNVPASSFPAGTKNSEISISENGALQGGNGGQVTITGLGYQGELDATNGADWDSNLDNIPEETLYNTDDAVTMGFNPTFAVWPEGDDRPTGWSNWPYHVASPINNVPTRETTLTKIGKNAARFVVPGYPTPDYENGDIQGEISQGMHRKHVFPSSPLEKGVYIQGSVDIYMVSRVGSGTPGITVLLYSNAALTEGEFLNVSCPNTQTGVWHRVPFTAYLPRNPDNTQQQIYGIECNICASSEYLPNGVFQGEVIFDNFRFSAVKQAPADVTIPELTVGTLHIEDNAVMIPEAVSADGAILVKDDTDTTWGVANELVIEIDHPHGQNVPVRIGWSSRLGQVAPGFYEISLNRYNGTADANTWLNMDHSLGFGPVYYFGQSYNGNDWPNFEFHESLPPGTYTYRVYFKEFKFEVGDPYGTNGDEGGTNINYRTLSVEGRKK